MHQSQENGSGSRSVFISRRGKHGASVEASHFFVDVWLQQRAMGAVLLSLFLLFAAACSTHADDGAAASEQAEVARQSSALLCQCRLTLPELPTSVSAVGTKRGLDASEVRASIQPLVERVNSHLDTDYVDGDRPVDARRSAAILRDDRALLSGLAQDLCRQPTDKALQQLSVQLLSAVQRTASVMAADAHLVAGGSKPAPRLLGDIDRDYREATARLREGDPLRALDDLSESMDDAWQLLARYQVTYSVSADRDSDGLSDLIELRFGSNPVRQDTDGDGLKDAFEVTRALGVLSPAAPDSDSNGVRDDKEDPDGDALTNLDEQRLGTDPLSPDSDNDGLRDGQEANTLATNPLSADTDNDGLQDAAEMRNGTDPRVVDTDGDGTPDVDEVATAAVDDAATGVRIRITGPGDLAGATSVASLAANTLMNSAPGQVSPAFDLNLDPAASARFQQAQITLPYQVERVSSTSNPAHDLRILYFDELRRLWVPASDNQVVDVAAHRVTATVKHFSTYAVFDIPNWNQTWNAATSGNSTCRPTGSDGGASSAFVDIALVIDSSGSMTDSDPNSLRQASAKAFVKSLLPQDAAAVVDFDSSAKLVQGLTGDQQALATAIDTIDSSGGTDIGAGVRVGLDALKADPDASRVRFMILLTDGVGSYDSSLTARAVADKVTIFTIGLGGGVDQNLLQSIATGTGGLYHAVANANDLPQVFRRIGEVTTGGADPGTDTDGDGLTDCQEINGFVDSISGKRFFSDPALPDTDSDGLTDAQEIGDPVSLASMPGQPGTGDVYKISSDPKVKDTDGDQLEDWDEADKGSDARVVDTDHDDVDDYAETLASTDPSDPDTDHDTLSDGFERANRSAGFDPLVFTERVSKLRYLADFTVGATAGELLHIDSLAWLAGNIAITFIPVAGAIASARDFIANAFHGDWVGAGLNVLGVLPVSAVAAVGGKLARFVARAPKLTTAALALTLTLLPEDASAAALNVIRASSKALEAAVAKLEQAGLKGNDLTRLVKSGISAEILADVRVTLAATKTGWMKSWRDAEALLRSERGLIKKPFAPPSSTEAGKGTTNYRFFDGWDVMSSIAYEVKTGRVNKSTFIEAQIEKETALIPNSVKFVEWHFYPSDLSGSLGPSKELLELLLANGRIVVIHLP
jgi:Mg-chelatase subunit ChlD